MCNELLNIVKPPQLKNIHFRMIGDLKLLLALSDQRHIGDLVLTFPLKSTSFAKMALW